MLLEQIQADRLQARKDRDTLKAGLLTVLVGEATTIIKDTGECDMVALIQKFIKGIDTILERKDFETLRQEKQILESYLPPVVSAEEIQELMFVLESMAEGEVTIGYLMKNVKQSFQGRIVDGKMASQIAKVILS